MSSDGLASPCSDIGKLQDGAHFENIEPQARNVDVSITAPCDKKIVKRTFLKRGSRMPISRIPSDPFAPVVRPIKNPPKPDRPNAQAHESPRRDQSIDDSISRRVTKSAARPPMPRGVIRQPPPRIPEEDSWAELAEKQTEELDSFLKDIGSVKASDNSSFNGESPRMGSLMKKVFSGGSPRINTNPSDRPLRRQRPVPDAMSTSINNTSLPESRSVRAARNDDDVTVRERIHQLDMQIEKFRKENEYCKKLRLERETALSEATRYKERALQELEAAEKQIEEEKEQLAIEKRRFIQEKDRGRSMVSQLRELTDENKQLREKISEMETDFAQKQKKLKNEIARLNTMLSESSKTKYELELEVKALSASQFISTTSSKTPAQQQKLTESLKSLSNSESSVDETKHADGRIDRAYKDGRREVVFASGLRKTVFTNGSSVVYFPNGDVKETSSDNIVTYHYDSTKCVQTTYPDGLEILKFASGQVEKHFPDGTKEITFPNKLVKRIAKDGTELGGGSLIYN